MKALLTKLSMFAALTDREVEALDSLQGPQMTFVAGSELVYEGQTDHVAYVLHSGWICSQKRLPDGARQIIDIRIAGDFVGLRSALLLRSDQAFEALTDVRVSSIKTTRLLSTFYKFPSLAQALLRVAAQDEAMIVEHLVSISRRDAIQRTAHFLLELWVRLRRVGQGSDDAYECPMSQIVLADVLGITPIHLNRVLRQLREAKLLIFRDGIVTFLDRKRLGEIATFDFGAHEEGVGSDG